MLKFSHRTKSWFVDILPTKKAELLLFQATRPAFKLRGFPSPIFRGFGFFCIIFLARSCQLNVGKQHATDVSQCGKLSHTHIAINKLCCANPQRFIGMSGCYVKKYSKNTSGPPYILISWIIVVRIVDD